MESYNRSSPSSRGSYAEKRKRARRLAFLSTLAVFLVISLIGWRLTKSGFFSRLSEGQKTPKSSILTFWENRDWDLVFSASDDSLAIAPLDSFYLGFKGLAAFYKGIELPEGSDRDILINAAIVALRKALAVGGTIPKAQFEYVLGKAYYYKGQSYWDASIRYLEAASIDGYEGADSQEYLAVAFAGLGENERSATAFESALQKSRAEGLLIAAAKAYTDLGKLDRAEAFLDEALSTGADSLLRTKARFLLADLCARKGDTNKAEELILAILQDDADSPEAHFRLGLLYQERGDPVRARAEWRKAVSIDPMHAASRQKLAEKL